MTRKGKHCRYIPPPHVLDSIHQIHVCFHHYWNRQRAKDEWGDDYVWVDHWR